MRGIRRDKLPFLSDSSPVSDARTSSVHNLGSLLLIVSFDILLVTNAAGSLNPLIPVGTILVIHDHLSFPGLTALNPLAGPKYASDTPRFLPLSNAYSRTLRKCVFHAMHKLGFPASTLAEGTYCWVTGPTFETAAEGRFLHMAGGDVVGASTVPEVVVAREEGMEVLALSLVTNMVIMPDHVRRSVREEVEVELVGFQIFGEESF